MFARPGLPAFDYVRANTPDEVVYLLQEHGPAARPLMGGTDLFPNLRDGKLCPRLVVDVKGLPGMREIVYDEQAGLTVGAAVTMNELARHPDVRAYYPLLAQAAASVASYQVRNRATIGGNLCNASPCADTAPATLVLEAELVLYGPAGERVVPAAHFFIGPGKTALQPAEFMTAIRFPPLSSASPPPSASIRSHPLSSASPPPSASIRSHPLSSASPLSSAAAPSASPLPSAAARYLKLGRCRSGDLALVGVALLAFRDGTPSGHRFRIGLGSVAPTPIRATEAEAFLADHPPGEETFARAAELAMSASSPITDVRATAEYQRAMVRTLTLRGLREVWAQLTG